jgi:hypothetical protein
MARTKQTARKPNGLNAPRKQLAIKAACMSAPGSNLHCSESDSESEPEPESTTESQPEPQSAPGNFYMLRSMGGMAVAMSTNSTDDGGGLSFDRDPLVHGALLQVAAFLSGHCAVDFGQLAKTAIIKEKQRRREDSEDACDSDSEDGVLDGAITAGQTALDALGHNGGIASFLSTPASLAANAAVAATKNRRFAPDFDDVWDYADAVAHGVAELVQWRKAEADRTDREHAQRAGPPAGRPEASTSEPLPTASSPKKPKPTEE